MTAFKDGKSKVIAGIKTPDLKTISFTLTKPTGDFLLPPQHAGRRPAAAGSLGMLHAAERVRPLRHLLGPVHDRRLGQARTPRAATRSRQPAASRAGTARRSWTSSATPPTTPPRTAPRRARTSPMSSRSRSTRTRTTSTPASTRGDIEEEVAGETPSGPAPVQGLAAAPHQRRRPHLVPDDEPHAAAVRRPARAPRGQLRGQPRGPAQVLGRPVGRRHRDAHRARRRSSTTSSRATRPTATARATWPRPRPR